MSRIYTEFRIFHASLEDKQKYEAELDKALKRIAFNNRSEWLRQMVRDAIYRANMLDEQTKYINSKVGEQFKELRKE
jgi:metal-responsive CopG/Arc/MetJ family transcriptional regulator